MSTKSGPFNFPFSRELVLQNDRVQTLSILSTLALQFAILGNVDVASRLISRLHSYDFNHGRHRSHQPLWLLWDSFGSWPEGEEKRLRDHVASQLKRSRIAGEDGERAGKHGKMETTDGTVSQQDIQDELDRLARDYARSWYWPDKRRKQNRVEKGEKPESPHDRDLTPRETRETIKAILKGIDEFKPEAHKYAETGAMAMDVSAGLVSALDLSLSLEGEEVRDGEDDELPSSQQILGMIARRMNANSQVTYLTQSRRIWPILKEGALAKEIGVDENKASAFIEQIEDAIYERLRNGRKPLSDLPLQEILQILDTNVRTTPGALELLADESPPETLQKPPASESDIKELEERVGVQLPDDYKDFLRLSNGLGEMFGGILFQPPLDPAEDVDWFEDEEGYFYDLPLDMPDDAPRGIPEIKVGMGISVGAIDIDNVWLIPPEKTTEVKEGVLGVLEDEKGEYSDDVKKTLVNQVKDFAGSMEEFKKMDWACVTWAAGGSAVMKCWPSFKAYLRGMADKGASVEDDVVQKRKFIGYALQEDEK